VNRPPPWLSRPAKAHPRRRSLLLRLAGAIVVAAALGAVLAIVQGREGAKAHHRARASSAGVNAPAPAPPPLSPDGLPLAKPAFALTGVGAPQADAVRVRFHHPPRAALLFDLDSGRVLWQHNPTLRLPIASLTKMMTALLAVEASGPRTPVRISRAAADASGSKVGLLPVGREVPAEALLYGLLLPSGNDAAVALAQHTAGSVAAFVARMNARAAQLGLGCTRYSSPHGFYDAGNFSCAEDLAELSHVVLQQPRIARVMRTLHAVVPFPIKGGKLYLYNNNPLLVLGFPGTIGLKTGYTEAAGRCLVAAVDRHGVRLGVVLLHSPAPATQARVLFDLALRDVYHQRLIPEPPFPDDD
jgi:serine-type D-Ala-D-Ala carboxypeptidase (penicillin-binding protein 5/6)